MAKPQSNQRPNQSNEDTAPRIGRPPVADDAKRSTLVRVLTTAAEYEELKQAAEAEAMSVSAWMRTLALSKARQDNKKT